MRYLGVAISFLLFTACSTQPHVVITSGIHIPSATTVYVVRHGWHTGFVIPSTTIQSRIPGLHDRFGDTPYIEFGWGDRAYYQTENKTLGITLRAVLWPTDAIVYAQPIPIEPGLYFPESKVETLCLERQHYAQLVRFIENSFAQTDTGDIIFSQDGLDENSVFFKGTGEYYLFNTCNTWTARGLKSAGLEISPAFKIQAASVMRALPRNTQQLAQACGDPEALASTQ
ncbi:DUF2459 domain-containing protein [Pseudomonadota bacterium]